MNQTKPDLSNGYDDEAESFIVNRSSTIGVSIVRSWAQSFPAATKVLEIGCGDGIPLTRTLIAEGLNVFAVDASPRLVSAFRQNFPETLIICQAAEQLHITDQRFDAALAWGLLFLLTAEKQKAVIQNISDVLNRGGRFLFTAPREAATWRDISDGRESISLGAFEYQSLLASAGLSLKAEYEDEGSNHYFEAEKD